MKNVLFIAPPAGGKGTISEKLVAEFGYEHISTGDLLREIDKTTPLGKEVDDRLKMGKLIDDDLVLKLLKEKLETLEGKPFILDGCPRNLAQAQKCDELFAEMGLSLDVVIELKVPYDVVLNRAIGRITCPKCKSIYNTITKKPRNPGKCDSCGENLIHRSDDNEETFRTRYDAFVEVTEPIADFYKDRGIYEAVDGLHDVYEETVSVLRK